MQRRKIAKMGTVQESAFNCPDCTLPLFRYCYPELDNMIACAVCGGGTWSEASDPEKSLYPELLQEEFRYPSLLRTVVLGHYDIG